MECITVTLLYEDKQETVIFPIGSNTVEDAKNGLFAILKKKFPECTLGEDDKESFELYIGKSSKFLKNEDPLKNHVNISRFTFKSDC